ncbi:hypothetical protein ACPJHH_19620 (plasmid) [Bacillus altitudinis]
MLSKDLLTIDITGFIALFKNLIVSICIKIRKDTIPTPSKSPKKDGGSAIFLKTKTSKPKRPKTKPNFPAGGDFF